jgi:hypothetical protein
LRTSYQKSFISPALSVYASDLFSAARHHPQLDATLLTAKSMKDAIDLARAGRVIGGDLTGIELVRDDAAFVAASKANGATRQGNGHGSGYTKSEGALDDDGNLDESPLATPSPTGNEHAHRYQPIEVVVEEVNSVSSPVRTETPIRGAWDSEVLEVSEADIARIIPRVMTHRLRVRDGPQCEVLGSAMFPAVPGPGDDHEDIPTGIARTTIKEILVRILAEV